MNYFTKEELEKLDEVLHLYWYGEKSEISISIENKIQSMIDNYKEDLWNTRKIASSHLNEATSLISHAICLLGLEDE